MSTITEQDILAWFQEQNAAAAKEVGQAVYLIFNSSPFGHWHLLYAKGSLVGWGKTPAEAIADFKAGQPTAAKLREQAQKLWADAVILEAAQTPSASGDVVAAKPPTPQDTQNGRAD